MDHKETCLLKRVFLWKYQAFELWGEYVGIRNRPVANEGLHRDPRSEKCNSPGGHGHAGRSIPKEYVHYRFLCNFGFFFRLRTKFRNETIRGQLSDVWTLWEKTLQKKKPALIKKKKEKKTANVCPLWWRFYLFLHQVAIGFLIPPPLWEDPERWTLIIGLGISKPTVFEIPWFSWATPNFSDLLLRGFPRYGKVPFGRDARHMTHISHRFYGFVSKRHGLLVHFGCKLGLPKNKNLRHSMRFFFQHALLISQLILNENRGDTPHFPWILK